MLIVVLVVTVALLAYANGSNDNFKAVATLYGSGTLSYRAALALASVAQLVGSIASVALAGALLKAFGGKGLVPEAVVSEPAFLVSIGLAAGLTVLLATRLGFPISTTHGLIGGLAGAAIAMAPAEIAWASLGSKYFVPLLVSPVLAILGAGVLYPLFRMGRRAMGVTETTCLCVGRRVTPVQVLCDGSVMCRESGVELTVSDQSRCERRYEGRLVGIPAQRVVDVLHILSGSALGFARGLNDTPKVLALLVAASWSGLDARLSLGIVAVFMCAGGLIHSAKLARTLGLRITEMNRGQGLVANLVSSSLVIGASGLGLPVSTTHVSTGAIFGIGLWSGRTDWSMIVRIVAAWVVTLPTAGLIGFAAGSLLRTS